ncbi:hypothetical protein ABT336_24235 [Micromonospora sp. NPDC000207]|uniref:hypothetical protein n=1 Tax=Micromonospora sp. NPDC000207 TaxID=3154246 RepID=UPI00332126E1
MEDGKRYSPLDRESVHADMAEDPITTRRNLDRQPAVAQIHDGCDECATHLPVRVPNRLGKIRVSLQEVSDMLGLLPGSRALRMYVTDDPHTLMVIVESDTLPPVPEGSEAPYLQAN